MMNCVVCGNSGPIDRAHVKDNSEFKESEDDRTHNIIILCPTHHRKFDNYEIGICPSKRKLIAQSSSGFEQVVPQNSIKHLKQEYVNYHNNRCGFRLRSALGLVPGQEYASLCD